MIAIELAQTILRAAAGRVNLWGDGNDWLMPGDGRATVERQCERSLWDIVHPLGCRWQML
jgi:hypothetical protein